jgi:hypothetical protein
MKKFIVIYHAPSDEIKEAEKPTPEQQAKAMEEWKKWAEKCGNRLLDLGAPLANGQHLSPDGKRKKSDKNVAGYSILRAESLEDVVELLKGHPHLNWRTGCSIEVHETIPMPEM